MTLRRLGGLCAVAALLSLPGLGPVPEAAAAQIRASEPSTLVQTIDGTVFRIDYFRPRARGRSPLFGSEDQGAVVWEHVWTPGANWATRFSFQKPVELQGVQIPAGTYSVWIRMDEAMMPHEFFLEPDTLIFHTAGPGPAEDQIVLPLTMEDDSPFREVLTWDFEDYGATGGVLSLRWGTHRFPMEVKVEPSQRVEVTAEEVAGVLGTYEVRYVDSSSEQTSEPFTVRLFLGEDEVLHADWEGVPSEDPTQGQDEWFNALDMWLLPAGPEGWFIPAESYEPGVLWDTWGDVFMEFAMEGGRGDSFEVRDDLDDVWMRGRRIR